MTPTPPRAPAVNPGREEALALAKEKLAAKKRENRQKSALVLTVSVLAIFIPALLIAGADLSGLFYPPPAPAPPITAMAGDNVTVAMVGTDDNGTVFMQNATYSATLGAGTFVPGLEAGLVGLPEGASFNLTVPPAQGYGDWARNRTTTVQADSTRDRNTTMETGDFRDRYRHTPVLGEVVKTSSFNATVVNVTTGRVTLRYEPVVGQVVNVYRYWNSTVTGFDNRSIFLHNELYVGYSYSRYSSASRMNLTYVVTSFSGGRYMVDGNPPLAGKTLHFVGTLVAVRPGSGARVGAGGAPVSLGTQACERCHAADGFLAMDASATAARSGSDVVVNVTVEDPWLHDLTGVEVDGDLAGAGQPASHDAAVVGTIPASSTGDASLTLPAAPSNASVTVVVNATAHHTHSSGGPPTDTPYQMVFSVDVGGPGRAATAPGDRPAAGPWQLVGQVLGACALGVMCYPIGMGLKRHAKLKPKLKWPPWPWVTTHFTLSLIVVAIASIHGVVLMSTKYRGLWTPEIVAGVIALAAVGVLGMTGVMMAKWTETKWKHARRVHYYLMLAVFGGLVIHVLVAGTTIKGLFGLA